MAEPLKIEELFLTTEDQRTLEELAPAIEMLEKNIAKLKRAGLDITKAEEDLKAAKTLREGMLRELTRK